jgi:hypothetical protein
MPFRGEFGEEIGGQTEVGFGPAVLLESWVKAVAPEIGVVGSNTIQN